MILYGITPAFIRGISSFTNPQKRGSCKHFQDCFMGDHNFFNVGPIFSGASQLQDKK